MTGGVRQKQVEQHCACACHCRTVFEKLHARLHLHSNPSPLALQPMISGEKDEIAISPVRFRASKKPKEVDGVLCAACCQCGATQEDSASLRAQEIQQVSLLYAPPTLLRELRGVTAFAPAGTCRRVDDEECACHSMWALFLKEVMVAYADRYTENVRVMHEEER